ncbi:MAG: PEP-CTERM system histidine kinase PrsK [Verrucomicrobia bacterium]|nr:PEP-CTERM system histidine kinase PrsK [Verrucomicrobiota bacterium]
MHTAEILTFLSATGAGILALIAALRAGRSIALWAFVGGMLAFAVERIFGGFASHAEVPEQLNHWLRYRGVAAAFLPGFWLLFSLAYARENARVFIQRWRWLLIGAFIAPIGLVFIPQSLPILTYSRDTVPTFHFALTGLGALRYLLLLISAILVLMNLERSFRASVGMIRWRIKFMLMGVAVLFIIRVFTASQALLYREVNLSMEAINSGALLVATLLIFRSIFRSEPIALNVHPSQSVLQGSVTVFLAGIYLVLIGILASLVTYFGGDDSFALKAFIVLVALVILAVLLQSDRINLYVRRFVSRHFKRPFYDYQTVWSRFTEVTASRVEQKEFCQAVVAQLADTFKSLCVTFWVLDDSRNELVLAASTSLTEDRARELKPDSAGTALVVQHLREHIDPTDIEKPSEMWAVVLRRCHPDEFHKGGNRVCVPIVSRGEVLAVIILGDRVGGTPFTLQDFDLLKTIGEHVSSGLLNVRLSQRLLQSREHEAFQTMAAFFVHDLKNAASTLSLMLQNLPTHFDDPEFRQDALRGVGKSVAHINHLISRLSELRKELKIQARESDLNAIVTNALASFEQGTGFIIEAELAKVPNILVDNDQFSKVIINLVLNAREATNGKGRLRIRTIQEGSWAVLTAADDGCGMTEEFLARSLFRPFQTTKKNGLGIGMFQSKMIVEAHGGRIAVESSSGQGTTFRVFLPLPLTPSAR